MLVTHQSMRYKPSMTTRTQVSGGRTLTLEILDDLLDLCDITEYESGRVGSYEGQWFQQCLAKREAELEAGAYRALAERLERVVHRHEGGERALLRELIDTLRGGRYTHFTQLSEWSTK